MNTYKLTKKGFVSLKKKLLVQSLFISFIPIVIFLVAFSSIVNTKITIPILIIFFFLGIGKEFVQIRRKEKEWLSFTITVSDAAIQKTQINSLIIEINFDEITRVIEIPDSGLSVQTDNPANYMFIPNSLEGYNEVKWILLNIKPIEISPIGVIDNLKSPITSLEPKKSFIKIMFKSLITAIAPFVIFLILLFFIILIFADFS